MTLYWAFLPSQEGFRAVSGRAGVRAGLLLSRVFQLRLRRKHSVLRGGCILWGCKMWHKRDPCLGCRTCQGTALLLLWVVLVVRLCRPVSFPGQMDTTCWARHLV